MKPTSRGAWYGIMVDAYTVRGEKDVLKYMIQLQRKLRGYILGMTYRSRSFANVGNLSRYRDKDDAHCQRSGTSLEDEDID